MTDRQTDWTEQYLPVFEKCGIVTKDFTAIEHIKLERIFIHIIEGYLKEGYFYSKKHKIQIMKENAEEMAEKIKTIFYEV